MRDSAKNPGTSGESGDTGEAEQGPPLPFSPLPKIDEATKRELKAAAMEANQSYLVDLVEEHSFCPFSRGGRAQGQTTRFVHYFSESDASPLYALMAKVAENPHWVVAQVVLPMIEISAEAWVRFCHQVTAEGNRRLGVGSEVFAVAPLHPELKYKQANPYSLIPLFRRSPDPTIQWVRLDGLKSLYEGRSGDTVVLEGIDIMTFMQKQHKPPLFDRIAETNQAMARRLGFDQLEESFAKVSRSARKRYTNILLGGGGQAVEAKGCACSKSEDFESKKRAPPKIAERDGANWALAAVRELKQGVPSHVRVEEVDLVLVRAGDTVHVLYGRCSHRLALLSDAIVDGTHIVCRHHGWDFALATGCSSGVPGEAIHRFEAWVSEGKVWMEDSELTRWRRDNTQAFELGELMP